MKGFWGRKIGMTQLFGADRTVIPVTALNLSDWKVIRQKTSERDGYNAVIVGLVRESYRDKEASDAWLKEPRKYFKIIREIPVAEGVSFTLGDTTAVEELFSELTKELHAKQEIKQPSLDKSQVKES